MPPAFIRGTGVYLSTSVQFVSPIPTEGITLSTQLSALFRILSTRDKIGDILFLFFLYCAIFCWAFNELKNQKKLGHFLGHLFGAWRLLNYLINAKPQINPGFK